MWELYDDLINAVPEDLSVIDCLVGLRWTLVRSELGIGMAMTVKGGKNDRDIDNIAGMPLKQLAGYVKSWNMVAATVGMAAINAAFNTPTNYQAITGKTVVKTADPEELNGFKQFLPEIEGKKVAMIGHFPNVDTLNNICRLSVLERAPQGDDYPDPACEYLLPEQDYVFITGTALINKTMPRLLELSRQARVVLIGPSVPITPVLFKYGVDVIASTVVLDEQPLWKVVQEGGKMSVFTHGGQMMCLR